MTITPKVKIGGGIVLTGAGAYSLYKAVNPKNENRFAYGVVGGLLIIGGLLIARKGWVQNQSLQVMPQEVDKAAERVKEIIAQAVKEGKVSNAAGSEPMVVNPTVPAPPQKSMGKNSRQQPAVSGNNGHQAQQRNQVSNPIIKDNWENGKVVGKVDLKSIEQAKVKKQAIQNRINSLKITHDKVKKEKGWDAALPIRNEIGILKAQLFYI